MLNWLTSREPGGEQQVGEGPGRACVWPWVQCTRVGREPPSRPRYRLINLQSYVIRFDISLYLPLGRP